MSRTTRAKLAAVPDASNDPIRAQAALVEQTGKERALAVERLTACRKDHQKAEQAFDDGQLDVVEKLKVKELLGRAERIYERATEAEQGERDKLDAMVASRRKGDYEAAIERAQDWLVKVRPHVDALVEVALSAIPKIDAACDVIVDAQGEHAAAEALEAEVAPVFTMRARGIRPADLEGVRFLVRVAIGRALTAKGLEMPGDWLTPVFEPRVGDALLNAYREALALLEPSPAPATGAPR